MCFDPVEGIAMKLPDARRSSEVLFDVKPSIFEGEMSKSSE